MCFYCEKTKVKNVKEYIFMSIDDVYDHWHEKHSKNAGQKTPFRFYPIDLLWCTMNRCSYYSSFRRLRRHHEQKHPDDAFVAVRNDRCVLCLDYSEQSEHECASLENVVGLDLWNPVVLLEEDLVELHATKCKKFEETRPKRIECNLCLNAFGSCQEYQQHHRKQHA